MLQIFSEKDFIYFREKENKRTQVHELGWGGQGEKQTPC